MRLYFDNAATSYPKPPAVVDAVAGYLRDCGAPAGRGAYRQAAEADRLVEGCRSRAARLLGVARPEHIIWTGNGTQSLNLAIRGLCRPGDHVVTSTWEHNSVLRPLRYLQDHGGVSVTYLPPAADGRLDPAALRAALQRPTRLVIVQQASNVIGVLQAVSDLGAICREAGALFLVDAAQSAGHVPISLADEPIDLYACSGHKGLLGPLGTGLLYVRPGVEADLAPLCWGGTGTRSEDDRQPEELPAKYESGNLNVPGLAGLGAALAYLEERTVAAAAAHEQALLAELWSALRGVPGVRLFGADPAAVPRTGVVSLVVDGWQPQDLAAVLDEHFGVQARAGLHCAPGVHRALGTLESGGTLRLSLGQFHDAAAVAAVAAALRELAGGHA